VEQVKVPMPGELFERWAAAGSEYRQCYGEIKEAGDPWADGHWDAVGGLAGELENWEKWQGVIQHGGEETAEAATGIKTFLGGLGGLLAAKDVLFFCEGMGAAVEQLDKAVQDYINAVKDAISNNLEELPRADSYPAVMNTLQQLAGPSDSEQNPLHHFYLDRDAIDEQSHTNMSDSPEGASIQFLQHGDLLLIGTAGFSEGLLGMTDWFAAGTLVVSKGGALSSGSIKVASAADEGQFKAAIKRFSKKSVTFA
jgi:hypothetical protein